jgi:3-oxoacyl-[acyl-carrier-protein] synthase II
MILRCDQKRVVVTGYGGLCSLGENVDEIWRGIMNRSAGYQVYSLEDGSIDAKFFGFLQSSGERYASFPKSITRLLPAFAKNALFVTKQALDMAFGPGACLDDHYNPFERGVIIGTGWGGMDDANNNNNTYRSTGFATSFATLMSMSSAATAATAMKWNMRGYQNTPAAACATGNIAIGDAYEVIRSGRAKMMIAGGSESLKEIFNVWAIDVLQALSKETLDVRKACCPFSASRSGFVLSEGAAVVCLEEYDSAVARGARILGEVTGYGNFTDATDMTAPAEDMRARVHTIRQAMGDAGRLPEDIGYINAHGTSTRVNDANENAAIKIALGSAASAIPISSTKSYTGHLISAAGALESIICLKVLETGTVPATIHLDEPDPDCDLDYVPNVHRENHDVDAILNLSFGFGGANAALMLERA